MLLKIKTIGAIKTNRYMNSYNPYEYVNSFERFNEEKSPARKYFFSSIKKGKIGDDGKASSDHISIKKIWDKFEMKNMGDYHDHYLKKMYSN